MANSQGVVRQKRIQRQMNYTIHQSTKKDIGIYDVNFIFSEDIAKVVFEVKKDTNFVNVRSLSWVYDRVNFWLAQEPNATSQIILNQTKESERVAQLFTAYDILYKRIDSNTFILSFKHEVRKSDIEFIVSILYPRMALKEKLGFNMIE